MSLRQMLAVALCLLSATACKRETPPPQANTKIFEPLYRSAKSIQGATQSGVNYQKYGELLQNLSTELNIAKDQVGDNTADQALLGAFQQVYDDYKAAGEVWKLKLEASDDMWGGEIPVEIKGKTVSEGRVIATKYRLPVAERKVRYINTRYLAIPPESMQLIWVYADDAVTQATDLFYSRQPQPPKVDRKSPPPPIQKLTEAPPAASPKAVPRAKPTPPDGVNVVTVEGDKRYHASGCAAIRGPERMTTLDEVSASHERCLICKPPFLRDGVVVW